MQAESKPIDSLKIDSISMLIIQAQQVKHAQTIKIDTLFKQINKPKK